MKSQFIIFFGIVFAVHGLVNYNIWVRGWQSLEMVSSIRPYYTTMFLIVATSYFFGSFLERKSQSFFSDALVWIGAIWFAAMVYFLLSLFLIDILRAINHFVHYFPDAVKANYPRTKLFVGIGLSVVIAIALTFGYFNAKNLRIKHLDLSVDKHVEGVDSLHVVCLSDMHLGSIIGRVRLQNMVDKINSCNADIVLLGGDQIDGDPHPAMNEGLGDILRQIKSKYGVYGITGNHEYIGEAETSCKFLEANGVHMIRDSVASVAGVYIVGREDRASKQFAGKMRDSLSDLTDPLDKSRPIILMDHQPFHLEEAEQNGVDLQFSGHTHHAQMWPLHLITEKVYEVSWGYKKKGNTHVYVSCGAGTWGPPIRIGNTPEVVDIVIKFR